MKGCRCGYVLRLLIFIRETVHCHDAVTYAYRLTTAKPSTWLLPAAFIFLYICVEEIVKRYVCRGLWLAVQTPWRHGRWLHLPYIRAAREKNICSACIRSSIERSKLRMPFTYAKELLRMTHGAVLYVSLLCLHALLNRSRRRRWVVHMFHDVESSFAAASCCHQW